MKQLRNLTGAFSAATLFVSLCAGQAPPVFNISNVAGNGTAGFAGDGAAATSAQLNLPFSVAVAGSNIYIADQANNRIRLVSNGNISTFAGTGTSGSSGDGAAATKANMANPTGVATDSAGNVYLSDTVNAEVRKVVSSGNINQFAGTAGAPGFFGDGAAANLAEVSQPSGLAVDLAGNVYIADTFNDRIRKVTTDGNIATIAGNGGTGYTGDGGPAIAASLNNPEAVAIDSAGNLYIADSINNRIRKVTTNGNIITIAGSSSAGGYWVTADPPPAPCSIILAVLRWMGPVTFISRIPLISGFAWLCPEDLSTPSQASESKVITGMAAPPLWRSSTFPPVSLCRELMFM